MRIIVAAVERETGLPSRWNGSIRVAVEDPPPGCRAFNAVKDWDCGVTIRGDVLTSPLLDAALVHEALHSVSAGLTAATWRENRGFEEGTVEQLTRLLGPRVVAALPDAAPFPDRTAFDPWVQALESLRELAGMELWDYYVGLLRMPLVMREQTVLQWVLEGIAHERRRNALAQAAAVLRRLM